MSCQHVLIVDDEASVLSSLKRALHRHFGASLSVLAHTSAGVALDLMRVRDFDIVISDLRMPEMNGITFLRRAAALRPHAVRMVLTASADFEHVQRAINDAGVFRYLCKPWRNEDLAAHLEAALALVAGARAQRDAAQAWHDASERPSAQELERRRLEQLEPGLTQVEFGPAGEVLMPSLTSFGDLGRG